MLEQFLGSGACVEGIRGRPLGGLLDELASNLFRKGYATSTARRILGIAGTFNRHLRDRGIETLSEIDVEMFRGFLEGIMDEGRNGEAASALRHVRAQLSEHGIEVGDFGATRVAPVKDKWDPLLDGYQSWGESICGCSATVFRENRRKARMFLEWCVGHRGFNEIGDLKGSDVMAFIESPESTIGYHDNGSHVFVAMRSFLRYLHGSGIVPWDLSRVVPSVRRWRLAKIPRHLPMQKVTQLIESVDTSTSDGLRDRAILTTLAFLGLRSQEVRLMRLEDINWDRSELLIPRSKVARERVLPIPTEVGVSLSDYILKGRPHCDSRFVFLRHKTPVGPLKNHGSVGSIISMRLTRAGIDAPSRGTHLLRHSLASGMVNMGVSIKEIADVLGHASIDTTAIYTKVDTVHLREAAMPFPEGGLS